MGRKWREAAALAAALVLASPARGGEGLSRRLGMWREKAHGFHAHATHPTVRGVMAMQSPERSSRAGTRPGGWGGIRPFGSVQTGLESGIGYGYPTLYARPGRGESRWLPWHW